MRGHGAAYATSLEIPSEHTMSVGGADLIAEDMSLMAYTATPLPSSGKVVRAALITPLGHIFAADPPRVIPRQRR